MTRKQIEHDRALIPTPKPVTRYVSIGPGQLQEVLMSSKRPRGRLPMKVFIWLYDKFNHRYTDKAGWQFSIDVGPLGEPGDNVPGGPRP